MKKKSAKILDLRKSHFASVAMSDRSPYGKRYSARTNYRLMQMSRDAAEKKVRGGKKVIILGDCTLPPDQIQAEILRFARPADVKGIEKLSRGPYRHPVLALRRALWGPTRRNLSDSRYYIPRKAARQYAKYSAAQYVWVLVVRTTIRGAASMLLKLDHLLADAFGEDKYSCDFNFLRQDFQLTDEYKANWHYVSTNKNFHFSFQDALNIKNSIADSVGDIRPLCRLLRDYFDFHQINCALKLRFEEDLDEFVDAIAFMMYQMCVAYFSTSSEPLGDYTPDRFKETSFEDFRKTDKQLALWRKALASFAPVATPQPDATATPLPHPGKYTEVVYWLEAEEAAGRCWYKDHNYNRTAMCAELSKKFHWEVDENSLRKAQQRHQKSN